MDMCNQSLYLLPPQNNSTFSLQLLNILKDVNDFYSPIHCYLFYSLTFSSFILNFAILVVLSRKPMRMLGVNVMMMYIGLCDFGCALWAGMHLILEEVKSSGTFYSQESLRHEVFLLFYDYFTIAFHSSSIFLGVGMAFCRIMSLNFSNKNSELWHTPKYAIRLTVVVFLVVFTLSLAFLPFHSIDRLFSFPHTNKYLGASSFDMSSVLLANNCLYLTAALWLLGFGFKMVPCVLLFTFSFMLLRKISKNRETSRRLRKSKQHNHRIDRSSTLIVSVLIIFLLTELPQAMSHMFGAMFISDYLGKVIINIENILDILSIINSTVIFLIYSILSLQFRQIFVDIFVPSVLLIKWRKHKSNQEPRMWSTTIYKKT